MEGMGRGGLKKSWCDKPMDLFVSVTWKLYRCPRAMCMPSQKKAMLHFYVTSAPYALGSSALTSPAFGNRSGISNSHFWQMSFAMSKATAGEGFFVVTVLHCS